MKQSSQLSDIKSQLKNIILDLRQLKQCRYNSLVVTKLEEACHWIDDFIDEAYEEECKD